MYLIVPILYQFKEVFLNMYLIIFTFDKTTSILANMGAYTSLVRQKIAIKKSYPPYLKGCQAKRQKLFFQSPSRIEFGSE